MSGLASIVGLGLDSVYILHYMFKVWIFICRVWNRKVCCLGYSYTLCFIEFGERSI